MNLKLKICGMKEKGNVGEVMKATPDFMGFIFYNKTPRYVGDDDDWIGKIHPEGDTKKVGVFVNEDPSAIQQKAAHTGIKIVQLHGSESPEDCKRLRDQGLEVIKVIAMGEGFSWSVMEKYIDHSDYLMFDTKGKYLGGNGIPFDWDLLEGYPFEKPFFLSGGIGPDNVDNIRFLDQPYLYAVDVNSRLEAYPGYKDLEKVLKFREKFEALQYDRP